MISATCGAIWGFAFGSDLAELATAFLPQDLIGRWIAAQAGYALPVGGMVGGVAAFTLIGSMRVKELSFLIGMAGGTVVGLVIERPSFLEMIHPIDAFSAVLWQQFTAFVGGALVWIGKKLVSHLVRIEVK